MSDRQSRQIATCLNRRRPDRKSIAAQARPVLLSIVWRTGYHHNLDQRGVRVDSEHVTRSDSAVVCFRPTRIFLPFLLSLAFLQFVVACETAPQFERNFQSEVVNQSTQDDVRAKFGTPEMVTPLNDGGEVWVYRYSRGKFSTGYAATAECWEYALTFNASKVLRKLDAVNCSGKLKGYDPTEDEKFLKEPGQR